MKEKKRVCVTLFLFDVQEREKSGWLENYERAVVLSLHFTHEVYSHYFSLQQRFCAAVYNVELIAPLSLSKTAAD